jgi:hypothetical protein
VVGLMCALLFAGGISVLAGLTSARSKRGTERAKRSNRQHATTATRRRCASAIRPSALVVHDCALTRCHSWQVVKLPTVTPAYNFHALRF